MRLFIANMTKFNVDFSYRPPGYSGVFSHLILSGEQVEIPHDFSAPDIHAVIRHHRRSGMRIAAPRVGAGLFYSIGRPFEFAN